MPGAPQRDIHHDLYLHQRYGRPSGSSHPTTLPQVSRVGFWHHEGLGVGHGPHYLTTNSFQKGQDPNDHYWIYFTTLGGSDVFFDGCMYVFNFTKVVADVGPYTKHGGLESAFKIAPAFFCDREIKHDTPKFMEERQRFSVLRNTDLHEAMNGTVEEMIGGPSAYKEKYSKIICDFMDKVAGRTCSDVEKDVLVRFATHDRCTMAMNIHYEEYLRFPESPLLGIDVDPGEVGRPPPQVEGNEKWWRSLKRLSQKQRKGEITTSELSDALDDMLDKHLAKADASGRRQEMPNEADENRKEKPPVNPQIRPV